MKSVIIFYIPIGGRLKFEPSIEEFKQKMLDFHVLILEDITRTKVEVEVFFKPEYK